ncbi:MAG: DUF1232 domain-containing protein [Dehalococcoidia bacterium]|nr:DUF1232 domain-containing protein [Dehalococcoidia bacterium]
MPWFLAWRLRALAFQRDAFALLLSSFDRRVPLPPKLITAALVLYALSPADLLPDPLPLLGIADDIGVGALGIALARRLVPGPVFEEHRATAARRVRSLRTMLVIAIAVLVLWSIAVAALVWLAVR